MTPIGTEEVPHRAGGVPATGLLVCCWEATHAGGQPCACRRRSPGGMRPPLRAQPRGGGSVEDPW